MISAEIVSTSAGRTRSIGRRIGELAIAGDIVLLIGALGTGKTCLTQGIAKGLGIDDYVVSPSFVLLREYHGRLPLYHVDLYRLDSTEEIDSLGLDDYLYYGGGICVVEWADKATGLFPPEHMLIEMQHLGSTKRKLRLQPQGSRYSDMLSHLKVSFKSAGK